MSAYLKYPHVVCVVTHRVNPSAVTFVHADTPLEIVGNTVIHNHKTVSVHGNGTGTTIWWKLLSEKFVLSKHFVLIIKIYEKKHNTMQEVFI
jgi:hypothetical protein